MIKAKYPLVGIKDFLEVSIAQPELDPKSHNKDRRCECKISGPNYEKVFHVYGVDELQCVCLAFQKLRLEIANFEEETKLKCEYVCF